MGYDIKISKEQIELYKFFHPKIYNTLPQDERERTITKTIQQICKDKRLPDVLVFFNRENRNIGSYVISPDNPKLNYINIPIASLRNSFDALNSAIHEVRHHEQYCKQDEFSKEVIDGLNMPLEEPYYFFQDHEDDAYNYTAAELLEVSKTILDLKDYANKQQTYLEEARKEVAKQYNKKEDELLKSVRDARAKEIRRAAILKDYLAPDMFGPGEHYGFENINGYSGEYYANANKTVFSITKDRTNINAQIIVVGDRADMILSSDSIFKGFNEIKKIATSFINDYNKWNNTNVKNINVAPIINDKSLIKSSEEFNNLKRTIEISGQKQVNKEFIAIKRNFAEQFLRSLLEYYISPNGKDGAVNLRGTENNTRLSKFSEYISIYTDNYLISTYPPENILAEIQKTLQNNCKRNNVNIDVSSPVTFFINNGFVREETLDDIIKQNIIQNANEAANLNALRVTAIAR